MGLFALPLGKTWQEDLDTLVSNIELLERNPDARYLLDMAQFCLDEAKQKYLKEKE